MTLAQADQILGWEDDSLPPGVVDLKRLDQIGLTIESWINKCEHFHFDNPQQ